MSIYKNPRNSIARPTPDDANDLTLCRGVFDIAVAVAKGYSGTVTPVMAIGDQIEVGVVPAGCKLVPSLSSMNIPILDSNGVPTAQFTLGTATTPAALKAASTAAAAAVLADKDFIIGPGIGNDIGSAAVNVPIYATFTVAAATPAVLGAIVANFVIRAFDSATGDIEVL